MDTGSIIVLLSLTTFVLVLVFVFMSRRQTKKEMKGEEPHAKSSLAKDGPGPDPIRDPRDSV